MAAVSIELGIPLRGYALEKFFEPEKIIKNENSKAVSRPCKWDRYIKYGVEPHDNNLEKIKTMCPNAYKLYGSPLWAAIATQPVQHGYWESFIATLDIEVKSLAFEFLAHPSIIYTRKSNLDKKPLYKLVRIGNDQAIAALIGLLRHYLSIGQWLILDIIETHIYNVIFNFLSNPPFCYQVNAIFFFMLNHILDYERYDYMRERPLWPSSPEKLGEIIWIEQKNRKMAESLGLISTLKQSREFYFWKHLGNNQLIVIEMALSLRRRKVFLKDRPKGLKWLITKLNKTRPRNQKLNTHVLFIK